MRLYKAFEKGKAKIALETWLTCTTEADKSSGKQPTITATMELSALQAVCYFPKILKV